jgi:hypothetical protein
VTCLALRHHAKSADRARCSVHRPDSSADVTLRAGVLVLMLDGISTEDGAQIEIVLGPTILP